MEVHLHLAAAYPLEPWLEHFEWLNPLFNEQLELRDGRMWVSERHGLGFTLSEQARRWTQHSCEFGQRPDACAGYFPVRERKCRGRAGDKRIPTLA